jgi:radical SAM superfamily enzyme YgiQ (UPF0313 family)
VTQTVLVDNFFHAPGSPEAAVAVVPHLGLMSLAAVLEAAEQRVAIFDPKILFARGRWTRPCPEFYDAWADELLARSADVIGFTAYGRSLPHVVRVAERIRARRPRQKIILGGPHATIIGSRILEELPLFDVIVRYEAEPTIVEIVKTVAAGGDLQHIPNLVYRSAGSIVTTAPTSGVPDVETLPDPALHHYALHEVRLSELSIEAGRGCPYACTFCSTANFFQRRYRLKSSARLVREMTEARDRYGVTMFNLNHDLFGLVRPNLEEFCRAVRGLGLEWKCSMRPDTLDSDLVDLLTEAGCRHIYFGVETGSRRLQRVLKKRLDLDETRMMIRRVVERGMHCTASFITGFPEETEEDQYETLDFLGELLAVHPHAVHPQLHVLSPEPGSELADANRAYVFDGVGPEIDESLDEPLIARFPDIFSVFYHYPTLIPRPQVLLASALVTHVMPVLGYPLTTHIAVTRFGGSLAAMFRRIIRGHGDEAFPNFDEAVDRLWRGLDSALAGPADRYLRDAARLSRILHRARSVAHADGAWIAAFEHDMAPLLRAIIERPAAPVAAARGKRKLWHVLRVDAEGQIIIGTVKARVVAGLHERADYLGARYLPLSRSDRELLLDASN